LMKINASAVYEKHIQNFRSDTSFVCVCGGKGNINDTECITETRDQKHVTVK